MDKRKLSVGSGIAILLISLPLAFFLANSKVEEAPYEAPVQIIKVPVIEANPSELPNTINFTGRVVPESRFDIYSEVTGRMEIGDHVFKTGTAFSKGEVLVQLNDDEFRQTVEANRYKFAALLSRILPDIKLDYQESATAWTNYLNELDAQESLNPLPETLDDQLRMYLNSNEVYSTYASIRQQELRLEKYSIKAPFDGVVTQSMMDPGSLIQPNTRLGEFTKLDPLELEVSIPAVEAEFIKEGNTVKIQLDGQNTTTLTGRVDRKNAAIDPGTQSIKLFIKLRNSSLRPGAYVEGTLQGKPFNNAVRIHQDALIRNDDIFVIQDSIATLYPVKVLAIDGDSVTITEVKTGTRIIDDFRDAAFEGTHVEALED